jgi:hypothetical protein
MSLLLISSHKTVAGAENQNLYPFYHRIDTSVLRALVSFLKLPFLKTNLSCSLCFVEISGCAGCLW